MTPEELQRMFHVEHHSLVPEYHLVQLTHHLARRHITGTHHNTLTQTKTKIPHEKPSKNPWKTETSPPSLLNDEMFIKAKENIKDVDIIGDLNNTVSVNFDVTKSSESSNSAVLSDLERLVDGQQLDVHKIDLEAFGKQLKLVLKKQEGLLKKDGLRMWKAHQNETQPHGVDYEELISVSDFIFFIINKLVVKLVGVIKFFLFSFAIMWKPLLQGSTWLSYRNYLKDFSYNFGELQ